MKVCMVSSYPPNKANLAEYGHYISRELAKNPVISELTILANAHESAPRETKNGRLRIIRCWKTNDPLTPFNILNQIMKFGPDIVYFNIGLLSWGDGRIVNFISGLTPILTKITTKAKVVITLHNVGDITNIDRVGFIKPNFVNKAGCRAITSLLLRAGVTVVTLKSYAKFLRQKYGEPDVRCIPHGTLRTSVKKPRTGGNRILAFGHWSKSKNLPLLLETFLDLSKKYNDAELTVAGESHPKFRNYLENLREKYRHNRIKFLGYVPESGLKRLFLGSTVIVLPYLTSTGSSGVLNLAMAYGRPVVAPDIDIFHESIREQKTHIELFKNGSKNSLAGAIEKILDDKVLQMKMAKGNLKASKNYTFDKIADRYVEIFKRLVKHDVYERKQG
ncbi:MAG: glycosyltransferase family 4 protein [Candidatus Aenigmarchaeota archaeon]|nr:glycosyltransferase family 4 protein [Candidatus Aenigmarchaeota archaeon]